jgi:hypothetical protein
MALDTKLFEGGELRTYTAAETLSEGLVTRLGTRVPARPRGKVIVGAVGNADVRATWCAAGEDAVTLNAGTEDDVLWSLAELRSARLSVGPVVVPSRDLRTVDQDQFRTWLTARLLGLGLDGLLRQRLGELAEIELEQLTARALSAALLEHCAPALWYDQADGQPAGALLLTPEAIATLRSNASGVEAHELAERRLCGLPVYPFDLATGVVGAVLPRSRLVYRLDEVELAELREIEVEYDKVGFQLSACADVEIVADAGEGLAFKLVVAQ